MRPRSFFTSLLWGNLLLIALILGLGAWWTYREMDRQSNWNSHRFQNLFLLMVQDELEESWPTAAPVIEQYCRAYSKRPELRLTVIDVEGRVLGDSEHPANQMAPHNNDKHPEFVVALLGKRSESVRRSLTKRISYRYIAVPIVYDDHVVGAVRVAVPVSNLAEARQRLFFGVTTCFSLMLLAAALFSLFLSWIWSKPLGIISQTARQIAEGNLGPIPEVSGSLEMIELHDAVDTMRRTVSRQLETITWQRERLQSVLQHLPDAVFALDSQDRIVYYNESAEWLFNLGPFSVAHSVQHLLRFPNLLDFYFERREKLSRHESVRPTILEVKLGDRKRVLEVELIDAVNHPHREDGDIASLLIVNDQTDAVRTERMKADFVANTSHELRTPLTTIRMTLDNAMDGIYPASAHREVFEMLDRGVHRLEALTDDLLALHGVEDTSAPAGKETTTLESQRQELEEFFHRQADEKGVELTVELPEGAATPFSVDLKRLGLVLQNLVDNALKFTPRGGKVRLRFDLENGNTLAIRCEDSGCGISPEDQGRVFERFYRARQKAENRQRGTGLGLSIVKHAVERLGGSLSLSSRLGVGSVFTVRIPIVPSNPGT